MSKIIKGENYRISVLTDRLIRLEYQEQGKFEDRITKMVVNRDFSDLEVSERREDGKLVVETSELILRYDEKAFSTNGLTIEVKRFDSTWHFSTVYGNSDRNLFGTARTLDCADGAIMLEDGIFGEMGFAAINDAATPVFDEKSGEYINRTEDSIDLYFFGYGNDFYGGLKDFYALCGKTPMIPRYALGNWWSRYYRYTEESYKAVLDHFKEEQIPLSVAVIDMDWHLTEVDPKYGTGWTGYTWNRDLFPDPKRFLGMLHDRGLKTTLNLHPADGIRGFEEMYEEVAKKMGVDAAAEEPVEFDFGNSKFRKIYFEEVMHPQEENGVDFWWIDWQQGTGKTKNDVDPLFLLNHYHYKDQENRNIRPMIFSRYAGPGSHRYPVGFSGDTKMTWRSLDFQPYFTSTASNIGYGWWSHDIGGHMLGEKDNERLVRWVQYGVFSPIMRLHSSNSPFINKEPWMLQEPYKNVVVKFMRLRHALLPYLYTETYRAYKEDKPLIRPMYYDLPENKTAFNVPKEYGFGEELIVGAITSKEDEETKLAGVNMLLPEGRWYDLFTGTIYNGGECRKLYRRLDSIPVLLRAGGIVPLSSEVNENGTPNPSALKLCIGAGADGAYTMYEDDGITMDFLKGKYAQTRFEVTENKSGSDGYELEIRICGAVGELDLIPENRNIEVNFYGIKPSDSMSMKAVCDVKTGSSKELETSYNREKNIATVAMPSVSAKDGATIKISGITLSSNSHKDKVFDILEYAWMSTVVKDQIFNAVNSMEDEEFLKWLRAFDISETLKDAIYEVYLG